MLDIPALEAIRLFMGGVWPALVAGSARAAGFMLLFPLFTRLELPQTLSLPVSIAISLPVIMMIHAQGTVTRELGAGVFMLIIGKEFAIGAMLGILMAVPIWAAQGAGDIIDLYRGASAPNLFDPVNASEVTALGSLLVFLSLALFVAAGGIPAALEILYESYTVWPVQQVAPPFSLDAATVFGKALTEIVRLAYVLAAPPLIVLALIDITFMFVERTARRFQIFDLTNAFKSLAVILLAPVYTLFFAYYLKAEMSGALAVIRRFPGS